MRALPRYTWLLRVLAFVGLAGMQQPVVAQIFGDLFPSKKENDSLSSKEGGVFLVPLLYYTPDTRLAYGAMGVYYFRMGNGTSMADKTRLSYVKLLADYTQNRQLDIWSSWTIFLPDEAWLLKGELRFRNFPDRFYGIGNTTSETQVERYAYNLLAIKLMALKQLKRGMFAGIDFQAVNEYGFILDPEGMLQNGTITGYNGGLGVGIGAVFTWDTRDNVVNPHNGFLFEVSSFFDKPFLGSDFDFNNYNIIYNRYWSLQNGHVLAAQAVGVLNTGDVPFLDMAKAGGDDILRGYARNRYRDKNFLGTQLEYRMPVYWRFGLVGFAGVGDVFSHPSQVTLNTLKYSFGTGLRFMASEKERLNIRIDYGWGRNSQAFYIMLTEAF